MGILSIFSEMIWSTEEVEDFAKTIVVKSFAENAEDHRALLLPIARRKYWPELRKPSVVLPRVIVSSSEAKDFVQHIMDLKLTDGEQKIPSEAIGIYCTVDPLSKKLAEIEQRYEEEKNRYRQSPFKNAAGELVYSKTFKTWLHMSHAHKLYYDCDVDVVKTDPGYRTKLQTLHILFSDLSLYSCVAYTIKTRGGFHILLERDKFAGERCHKLMLFKGNGGKGWFGVNKDSQVPVPGTIQGGFHVKRISDLQAYLLGEISM